MLIGFLGNAQIIDFLNPQLKGKVKTAHYIAYFDAGDHEFAKPYDESIIKEFQYHFDKKGNLESIVETQNVGDCPFSFDFKNGKIKKFEQKLWNGNFLQKGTITWSATSYEIELYNAFKNTVKQKFVLNSNKEIEESRTETSDKDGLFRVIQQKLIREEGKVVKILESKSNPKTNSAKDCEIVFSEFEFDSEGNLTSYRTKDSCSATYEKHKLEIEYW